MGVQGRLIFSFTLLLILGLEANALLYSTQIENHTHVKRDLLKHVDLIAAAVALIVGIGAAPLLYLLIHQILLPIRQLVAATNKIAAGDYGTRVDTDRTDMIGRLARSFNEMVNTVKRQQDDLAEINRQLEEKVRQRTSQLAAANQQLNVEMSEKEEFIRAISHDLSAPLRNINGMATTLLAKHRSTLEEDVIHRLERIQKNVEVEADLIAELLELSRIKTRRQKMEDVNVTHLVQDIADVFESDLKSRAIDLAIDTPLPQLHCERARWRQVFQNLIDNAIKYMGDSRVRQIHIGCELTDPEPTFYVRDTGHGIDAVDLPQVFMLFQRGRNAAVQKTAGKGVGLASVKSIIETYGGKVWAESTVGQGTTFRFTIDKQYIVHGHQMPAPTGGSQPFTPVAA